jgi:DNA-binding CsgD family transcriptional regulator
MKSVAERDLQSLSEAIYDLRGAISSEEFPAHSLEVTTRLVRNDAIAWNEVDPVAQRAVVQFFPDIPPDPVLLARFQELASEHPVIRHIAETGDGSARKISDFMSSDEFHEQRIYRELYQPLGAEHQMSVALPSVQPRIIAIVANRGELGDDFDERDRLLFNLLRPHLTQSYEMARDRRRIHRALATATSGLQADGAHMIVLDDPPHELTAGAMTVLYRAFGAPGRDDALPRRVTTWLARERARALAERDHGVPVLRQPLVADRHGIRTTARLVPGDPVDGLLLREERRTTDAVALQTLGLTAREADVLSHVASGQTNAAIATALHVEPSTVKTHLENIYRKLGVRGRVGAVAMAFDLLATAGPTS